MCTVLLAKRQNSKGQEFAQRDRISLSRRGSSGQQTVLSSKKGFHDCLLHPLRSRFAMATSDNRPSRPPLLLLWQILIIMAFSVPRKAKFENCTPSVHSVPFSNFLTKTAPFPALSAVSRRCFRLSQFITEKRGRASGTRRRPIHSLFRVSTSAAFSAVSLDKLPLSSLNSKLTFWPLLSQHNRAHSS